jgi:hypothetical protein
LNTFIWGYIAGREGQAPSNGFGAIIILVVWLALFAFLVIFSLTSAIVGFIASVPVLLGLDGLFALLAASIVALLWIFFIAQVPTAGPLRWTIITTVSVTAILFNGYACQWSDCSELLLGRTARNGFLSQETPDNETYYYLYGGILFFAFMVALRRVGTKYVSLRKALYQSSDLAVAASRRWEKRGLGYLLWFGWLFCSVVSCFGMMNAFMFLNLHDFLYALLFSAGAATFAILLRIRYVARKATQGFTREVGLPRVVRVVAFWLHLIIFLAFSFLFTFGAAAWGERGSWALAFFIGLCFLPFPLYVKRLKRDLAATPKTPEEKLSV